MKKILFAFAAAAVLLSACTDINVVDENAGKSTKAIKFRAFTSSLTKTGEFVSTAGRFPANTYLSVAASHMEDGVVVNPNFLGKNAGAPGFAIDGGYNLFTVDAAGNAEFTTSAMAAVPYASEALYYPLNGHLDFLSCAVMNYQSNVASTSPWIEKTSFPDNLDSAGKLEVKEIDVIENQADFLWAASNGNNSGRNSGIVNLDYNHAQALLIFNGKFMGEAHTTTTPTTYDTPLVVIDDICFWDESILDETNRTQFDALFTLQMETVGSDDIFRYVGIDPSKVTSDMITLKNKGTFSVDNSKKTIKAGWSGITVNKTGLYYGSLRGLSPLRFKYGATPGTIAVDKCFDLSPANLSGVEAYQYRYGIGVVPKAYNDPASSNATYQLFSSILIPEQEMQNFIVFYHIGNEPEYAHYFVYNGPRAGVWRMGYKYIYDLEINATGEITFDVKVENWKDGGTTTVTP